MKAAFLAFLAKLGVKTTGLYGWVVSLLIDKAWAIAKIYYAKLVTRLKLKKEAKKDEVANENYKENLKDGVSEQSQVDATTDLINRP